MSWSCSGPAKWLAAEQAQVAAGHHAGGTDYVHEIIPQLGPTPGLPYRHAIRRRKDRVMHILHTLPPAAQQAIVDNLDADDHARYWTATRS